MGGGQLEVSRDPACIFHGDPVCWRTGIWVLLITEIALAVCGAIVGIDAPTSLMASHPR